MKTCVLKDTFKREKSIRKIKTLRKIDFYSQI